MRLLINVPIMKAHNQTLVTCSLKNLKGTMPRSMKSAFHGVNLHRAIAQLDSVLVPHLIIVDGLQGDLHSESGHDPVVMDRIILGTNPVEVIVSLQISLDINPGTFVISPIARMQVSEPVILRKLRFNP